MPKSAARTGFGSYFAMAAALADIDDEESVWAEVTGLKPPGETWDTAEATHFGSPGRRREWIKTLIDGGEADIVVNYVPGSPTDLAMQAAFASEDAFFYMFFIPKKVGGWLIKGEVLVTGLEPEVPLDERMQKTARLKFTGDKTEAAAE